MYLHLGEDVSVIGKSIIAVIDIERTTVSKDTQEFLRNSQKKGIVKNVSEQMPKSFVVSEYKGKVDVYVTNVSTATILKRSE